MTFSGSKRRTSWKRVTARWTAGVGLTTSRAGRTGCTGRIAATYADGVYVMCDRLRLEATGLFRKYWSDSAHASEALATKVLEERCGSRRRSGCEPGGPRKLFRQKDQGDGGYDEFLPLPVRQVLMLLGN